MKSVKRKEERRKKSFGLGAIFQNYTFKDFGKDSIIPLALTVIISLLFFCGESPSQTILGSIIDMTISILPCILGLVVAGYTILISFYWSDLAKKISDKDEVNGPKLLMSLNSSFAAVILFITIALLYTIIIKVVSSFGITYIHHNIINMIALAILLYLDFFSFFALKDSVIDLFNIGSLSTKFSDKNENSSI